jgi:hypothetical protein
MNALKDYQSAYFYSEGNALRGLKIVYVSYNTEIEGALDPKIEIIRY